MILLSLPLLAQDADSLRALGAEVTQTGGAITRVSFKDCAKLGEPGLRRIGSIQSLKTLTLYGGKKALTATTLPLLARLTELEELNTGGIHVSDEEHKKLNAYLNP